MLVWGKRCHPSLQAEGHKEEGYVLSLTWAVGSLPGPPFPPQRKFCRIMKLWQQKKKTLTEGEKHSGLPRIIAVSPW